MWYDEVLTRTPCFMGTIVPAGGGPASPCFLVHDRGIHWSAVPSLPPSLSSHAPLARSQSLHCPCLPPAHAPNTMRSKRQRKDRQQSKGAAPGGRPAAGLDMLSEELRQQALDNRCVW